MHSTLLRRLVLGAMLAHAPKAEAQVITYTSYSDWLAAVSHVETDDLDDVFPNFSGSLSRSVGPYEYSVANTFSNGGDLTIDESNELVFGGFTPNVFAFGGDFRADYFFTETPGLTFRWTVAGVEGTQSFAGPRGSSFGTFFGIVASSPIEEFRVSAALEEEFTGYWASADNMRLAKSAVVPEPASLVLTALGLSAMGVLVRRRNHRPPAAPRVAS